MTKRAAQCSATLTALLTSLSLLCAPAHAGVANAGISGAPASNPLAGVRWGNYDGPGDEAFPSYRAARGENRKLLGLVALRPRVRWFGNWYSDDQAGNVARNYINNVTRGNPNVLSQMAVFRLTPWEGRACKALPTAAEQASYKRWIGNFARGIGSARVALVLQPDLPEVSCVPHHSKLPLQLVAFAAKAFSALPHTTVYIDAGAADWDKPSKVAGILRDAGVKDTRGFALNITHYDSTVRQIFYGQRVVRALAGAGVAGMHFVISTAENGHPFTHQQWQHSGLPNYFEPPVCASPHARGICVTLGIPPTTDVANPKWRLPGAARKAAGKLVDAYMWIGRPWLRGQTDPFEPDRAIAMARSTPF